MSIPPPKSHHGWIKVQPFHFHFSFFSFLFFSGCAEALNIEASQRMRESSGTPRRTSVIMEWWRVRRPSTKEAYQKVETLVQRTCVPVEELRREAQESECGAKNDIRINQVGSAEAEPGKPGRGSLKRFQGAKNNQMGGRPPNREE